MGVRPCVRASVCFRLKMKISKADLVLFFHVPIQCSCSHRILYEFCGTRNCRVIQIKQTYFQMATHTNWFHHDYSQHIQPPKTSSDQIEWWESERERQKSVYDRSPVLHKRYDISIWKMLGHSLWPPFRLNRKNCAAYIHRWDKESGATVKQTQPININACMKVCGVQQLREFVRFGVYLTWQMCRKLLCTTKY